MRLIGLLNKIVIYFFLTSSDLVGNDAFTYVYLLPFDNIQNDSSIDWISVGLIDMAKQEFAMDTPVVTDDAIELASAN